MIDGVSFEAEEHIQVIAQINDENICCKRRSCCCKKRTCIPKCLTFFLVIDILGGIMTLVVFVAAIVLLKMNIDDPTKKREINTWIKTLLNVSLASLPYQIPYWLKVYYAIKWLKKKPLQRSAFLPYYRMALTSILATAPSIGIYFIVRIATWTAL